jgi:Fe-S-cluster formation regulator IscX/YfhJ
MTATKTRLAAELRAASIKIDPAEVAFFEALARRAETGEFDDYGDMHACGPTALHNILTWGGQHKFAARVAAGEFDASPEESEAWARAQTDPEVIRMMDAMGIGPDRSKDQ